MTHRCLRSASIPTAILVALTACSKKEETDPLPSPVEAPETPAPAAPAALQGVAPERPGAPATCSVVSEKVWAQVPGLATGITPTALADGRIAVGLSLGGRPHVVVFDGAGEGEAIAVPLGKHLRSAPEKGGKRSVGRITPGLGSGGAIVAFADYQEEADDHRRVVCGPTDSEKHLLEFHGKPLISRGTTEESASAADPAPAAEAAPQAAAEKAPAAAAPEDPATAEAPATPRTSPPTLRAGGDARRKTLLEAMRKRRAGAGG
jgi:hypothetical protein